MVLTVDLPVVGDTTGAWGGILNDAINDIVDAINSGGGGSAGVASFNTRTGAVTLTKSDVTATALSYSDVGADVAGAASTVNTALTSEVSRATAQENLKVAKANNFSDIADIGTSKYNLKVVALQAQCVATTNQSTTGQPTIDGYATTNDDIVLLTGQTTPSQNGLWALPHTGTGSWLRPTEFPAGGVIRGRSCIVNGGSLGGTIWVLKSTSNVTIDTTSQTWSSISVGNPGSFFFSADVATITATGVYRVGTTVTVGACSLYTGTAPSGSSLTCVLQVSTDSGSTWSTVQSLSITSGSTTMATATPSTVVASGSLVRVNCTSVGSTTAATNVVFQADYS